MSTNAYPGTASTQTSLPGCLDEEFGPYSLNKRYDPSLEEEQDAIEYC